MHQKIIPLHTRSNHPEEFCKKGVLEISQISQENICAASFAIKLQVVPFPEAATGGAQLKSCF